MYGIKISALILIIFYILSNTCFSSEYKIIPENKAKIFRKIGETVYVACKNNGTLSTKCLIDCGNGKRFESINGLCTYLKTGVFQLNIAVLKENVDRFHTATVTVTNNTSNPINRKNKQDIATRKNTKSHQHPSNSSKHIRTEKNTFTAKDVHNDFTENQTTTGLVSTQTISTEQALLNEQNLSEIIMENENLKITLPNVLSGNGQSDGLNSLGQNIDTININSSPTVNQTLDSVPSGNNQSYGFQWQHTK